MKLRHLILAIPFILTLPAAAQLRESDVQVKINRIPADAPVRTDIKITAAKPEGQYIQVSITNTSKKDIALRQLLAELPWTRPAGAHDQINAGAWINNITRARFWPAASGEKIETGTYLVTRASTGSTFAGFVTWKIFNSKLRWEKDTLVIAAEGEGRILKPGETVDMEKVWLVQTPGKIWHDLLFAYAGQIAAENNVRLNPPKNYIGWSTWDYYGRKWDHDKVGSNAARLTAISPEANLLQIDGGWWSARGDYTLERPDLQSAGGMKRIAQLARSQNLVAGIHLDGFRGDNKATLTREHPDYFLHDGNGKLLLGRQKNATFPLFDFSNPGMCEHMKNVLRHIRRNWGYDYIKIDFMRYGINEYLRNTGAKNTAIVPYDRSLTSVERYRRGLAAMREGMGPDAYFLACGAYFGPCFGYIDGMRTGPDVSPQFAQYQKCAVFTSGNFYFHGKIAYNDADYIVVRAAADQDKTLTPSEKKDGGDLALNEAWMWTHYAALCGGPRLNSDNLNTLRPERRDLFLFATAFPNAERYLPLDFWAHAKDDNDPPAVILTHAKGDAYLGLFNWTDKEKTIALAGITAAQFSAIAKVSASPSFPHQHFGDKLTVTLPARNSTIIKLPAGDFDTLRHAITVD